MREKLIALTCLLGLAPAAGALENFSGTVVSLEPTYLPAVVAFRMDTGNATCPAGTQLKWQKADVENNKAVYSTLMAALMSGKKVDFYFNDGDTNCIGAYIHLLKD